MPNPSTRGPWETAAPTNVADATPETRRPVLLHAVIQPNRTDDRWPRLILIIVAIAFSALSLPFVLRGEPIVAVLLAIEVAALALATRAYRRWAGRRCEELILYADSLEVRIRTGDQVTVDRLPTAWLTIEPLGDDRRAPSGLVIRAAQRRMKIGRWLGPAHCDDLRQTLEAAVALARRGGLAASTAPTRTWSSRTALAVPVDPALWAGGAGRS